MDKGWIVYLGGLELPDKNADAHRVIVNGKLLQTLVYNVIYCGIAHNKQEFNIDKPSGSTHFDSYPIPYPRNFYQWRKYFFELKKYHDIIVKYGDVKYIICYNLPTGSLFLLRRYFRDRRIKDRKSTRLNSSH